MSSECATGLDKSVTMMLPASKLAEIFMAFTRGRLFENNVKNENGRDYTIILHNIRHMMGTFVEINCLR